MRTITVALNMSKAVDPINIHTQIRKLIQTKITGTIIKFITNYAKPTHHIEITHPHNVNFTWTKQNNVTLNPDKTNGTLFTPAPAEYNSNLYLKINNTALPMATHPKVLGLTFDPKLTYNTCIHNTSVQTHKPLQIVKHSPQQDGVNRRRHS